MKNRQSINGMSARIRRHYLLGVRLQPQGPLCEGCQDTKIAKSHPSKGKTNLCPVTAPSTEAVINLDTAKGVSVSLSILSLADEMTGLSSMPCESNGHQFHGPTRS